MSKKINRSLYWKCQLLGWSFAAAYWAFNAYISGRFDIGLAFTYFVFDLIIGIGVTHAYRQLAHRKSWTQLNLSQLFRVILPSIIITGIIYAVLIVIKNYCARLLFNVHLEPALVVAFQRNFLTVLATGIRLMAIWILAFHLYHYAMMQIRIAKENARLQVAAKEAQLNNLSAQLNPHFFFNSLNTIKALIVSDPQNARSAIDLLSELLRNSLYQRDNTLIPLNEEISLVNDYLELEKIRFEDRLCFQIDIDKDMETWPVLPLSIQTLAENAIKHGIAKSINGGIVKVEVKEVDSSLKITVQNPGVLKNEGVAGVGLQNLQNRLALQYGDKASLTLIQLPNEIVSAVLLIPVIS
ncbi:MAG TPA: histidine kinase [Mucilaginibacter sp.]